MGGSHHFWPKFQGVGGLDSWIFWIWGMFLFLGFIGNDSQPLPGISNCLNRWYGPFWTAWVAPKLRNTSQWINAFNGKIPVLRHPQLSETHIYIYIPKKSTHDQHQVVFHRTLAVRHCKTSQELRIKRNALHSPACVMAGQCMDTVISCISI